MLLMLIFQISLCSPHLLVPINISNKEDKTPLHYKWAKSNSLPKGPQKKPERTQPMTNGLCKATPMSQVSHYYLPDPYNHFALQYIFVYLFIFECNRATTKGPQCTPRDRPICGWNTATSDMEEAFTKPQYFRAEVQSIQLRDGEELRETEWVMQQNHYNSEIEIWPGIT